MKKYFHILLVAATFGATSQRAYAQTAGKTEALESLGFFGSWAIYNTYEVIGSINDGYLVKAWDKKMATDVMNEQLNCIDDSRGQWSKLMKSGFITDSRDSTFITSLNDIYDQLRGEATSLANYIENPSEENHQQYRNYRAKAWELIKVAFDIKDEAMLIEQFGHYKPGDLQKTQND